MPSMKQCAVLLFLAAACGQQQPAARQASDAISMETLESADAGPSVLDPPPTLNHATLAPKPHDEATAKTQTPLTADDEQLRAALPFTPAIAMDPVDGSKISIRATTPTLELRNHIYYFSSEANRQTFAANPDHFTKGLFSHL